jgi:hypothetical protein
MSDKKKRSRPPRGNGNVTTKKVNITSFCGEEVAEKFDVSNHSEKFTAEPASQLDSSGIFLTKTFVQTFKNQGSVFFIPASELHRENVKDAAWLKRLEGTVSSQKSYDLEYIINHQFLDMRPKETRDRDPDVKLVHIAHTTFGMCLSIVYDKWIFKDANAGTFAAGSAHQVQKGLFDYFNEVSEDGHILISTNRSGKYISRYMLPFKYGIQASPDTFPFYPGFFTPFSQKQSGIHRLIFNSTEPGCAAGLGCLYRKEFKDEADSRIWRTIHFCEGKLENFEFPVYSESRIEEFVCRLNTAFANTNHLAYTLYIPNGDSKVMKTIGMALLRPSFTMPELMNLVRSIKKLNLTASDYILPRIVRIYDLCIPSVFELQEQEYAAGSDHTTYIYCGEQTGYQILTNMLNAGLSRCDFKPLWKDNCFDWAEDDLNYGIRYPCVMNQHQIENAEPPSVWYHSECIHALHNTNPKVTKYPSIVGLFVRYKCPCCDEVMKICELSSNGTFKKNTICEGKYPSNCIDLYQNHCNIINAGNFIALETKALNSDEQILVDPTYSGNTTDLSFQIS